MNISGLRTRVVFQRNTVSIDEVGNHLNSWTDYYACWATVTSSGGEENSDAQGRTVSQERLAATVRYCSEIAAVTTTGYRARIGSKVYDITSIDEMSFKGNSRKFTLALMGDTGMQTQTIIQDHSANRLEDSAANYLEV